MGMCSCKPQSEHFYVFKLGSRPREITMPTSDLVVDGVYPGGRAGNASDDPLGALVGVSNSGGFRYLGSLDNLELVVLTTSRSDPNWPDEVGKESGAFTYYGDNKNPGRELHDTQRFGNEILRRLYAYLSGIE